MPFSRDKFAIYWSMPPSPQDWANVLTSHVTRVQLEAAFLDDATLLRLGEAGVTQIAARLSENEYMSPASRTAVAATLSHAHALHPGLDTVIIGVEPENPYDFRYGHPWGEGAAFVHVDNFKAMAALVRGVGLRVVSPGWTARGHYRDWRQGVQAGRASWLEITRLEYDKADANGFHWDGADGTTYDINERMRIAMWQEQADRHKLLHIDELVVDRGTNVQRMTTYLQLATRLLDTNPAHPLGGAGERVEWMCPFVSNGTGQGYPPEQIITDPAAYALVAQFIAGRNFT